MLSTNSSNCSVDLNPNTDMKDKNNDNNRGSTVTLKWSNIDNVDVLEDDDDDSMALGSENKTTATRSCSTSPLHSPIVTEKPEVVVVVQHQQDDNNNPQSILSMTADVPVPVLNDTTSQRTTHGSIENTNDNYNVLLSKEKEEKEEVNQDNNINYSIGTYKKSVMTGITVDDSVRTLFDGIITRDDNDDVFNETAITLGSIIVPPPTIFEEHQATKTTTITTGIRPSGGGILRFSDDGGINSSNGYSASVVGGIKSHFRRPSLSASVISSKSRESAGTGTAASRATRDTRKSSMTSSVGEFWNRLGRKSDVWEEMSDLDDDEDDTMEDNCCNWHHITTCITNGFERTCLWWKVTLKTAIHTPSVWLPCVLLFIIFVVCGLLIIYGFETAETNARIQTATSKAEQTDLFFVRVLENAFVPLFTMAQFVKELPEFHLLDIAIGHRCDPLIDEFNCTNSTSVPVLEGKEQTHRDMSTFASTEYGQLIEEKFESIASGIKANSGLGKSLVSIQLAPKGVVSMIYPMVNCMDFDDGYCMNNTGAWGHDLLNDPNRVAIAKATVPAEGVVTAGPLKIIQGEDTFIARIAINFPNPKDNVNGKHSMIIDDIDYPCWGFAVVLLNWKLLKEESNIYKDFAAERMEFKLIRTDIKDGEEKVVTIAESPNATLIENDNITLALDTGDNGWVIAVGYDDGFSPNYKKWAYPIVFIASFAFSLLLMLVLVSKKEHEQILANLMPRRAIRKLAKGKTVVDRFTNVTIFFSDIAGYTKMSSDMTPIEVMSMLNGLFSKFDALAKKHGVFKVETIGDAYIAIAGAPERCSGPQAAEKITLFALDALQVVKEHTTEGGAQLAIRAGLASGPVVAGVLGQSLPKYTLFGDTVNFAARMEQTGQKGKLQICPTTHRMLIDAPNYHFIREERRDETTGELGVECKGKGRQYTYWVNSACKQSNNDNNNNQNTVNVEDDDEWQPDPQDRRTTALVGETSSERSNDIHDNSNNAGVVKEGYKNSTTKVVRLVDTAVISGEEHV